MRCTAKAIWQYEPFVWQGPHLSYHHSGASIYTKNLLT
ncbi:hypothetical protein MTBUT4_660014 [Magnetospirillum sp. UT-4]|nr:hypothetical protein MTBUT4_660014 [Magnetospirillum sp. UT-4]